MTKPRAHWTDAEIGLLTLLYPDKTTATIATLINKSVQQIYDKARKLGIKKSAEFMASPASGRTAGQHGQSHRFTKGHEPWNKGIKGLNFPGSQATQFKKGNRTGKAARNYQPIGHERLGKDGYLQRKINDDMPLQRRWRAVHIILWESVNGPLPKGYCLAFRDKNKTNIQIDNLELITRIELAKRNSVHNYGTEIAQLYRLKGAITRQINKREKEQS